MSLDRTRPFWVQGLAFLFSFIFNFLHTQSLSLSLSLSLSVAPPPPFVFSSSLLLPFLHHQASLLPASLSSSSSLPSYTETTLLCSSPHLTSLLSSQPPTGRHSPQQSTPLYLCAPLQPTSQIRGIRKLSYFGKIDKNVVDDTSDKYDQSNAAQSSKKEKKSYKPNVWIHRLDIGKDGEPRVECLGCGKVKMRIEERMLSS
ncbi:hypothetical protein M9H77_22460 [Catharanthus roseus]|uniref:Uncharacterized protein n=1 Tax=Catharanthus roseus TaxID=4058 RepID=A0ACC0AT25_CATRO|nr:hypothetical protein M9H77_22460 [Catharanthus roseus]